ncbi:MAG: ABC transporter substrate-binding protein, partial [Planctomycetota bacterium]
FAPFLRGMSQEIVPRHVLEKSWKDGAFNSTWGVNTPPGKMVGSGPFILVEYRPAERVVLERNPRYWRKDAVGKVLPYLDRVIHVIVQDTNVALLKFRSGEVDLYGMRGVDVQVLAPTRVQENFTIYDAGPSLGSSFLVFNENPGKDEKGRPFVEPRKLKWFRNVLFRRACSHAIDRNAIIETLMNGWGYPQYGPMTVSEGFFYNVDTPKYEYDPAKAKELLQSLGLVDYNGDGILEDPRGKNVEFNLFTNAENDVRIRITNSIRKDLENVGIRVNFLPLEFNALVTKLGSPPYDWEAILLGLTGGPEPHFGQNVWHSSGQLHEWYPQQESPDTPEEAEIDRIFAAAVQELDPAKRKALYDRWQVIAAEQQWMIYTVSPASLTAVRNKFGNLDPRPIGGMLHNLDELYILQR